MTYAELLEKVQALVTGDHFVVRVETWRGVHDGAATPPKTAWGITTFAGTEIRHRATGNTPEGALAMLVDLMSPDTAVPVMEVAS